MKMDPTGQSQVQYRRLDELEQFARYKTHSIGIGAAQIIIAVASVAFGGAGIAVHNLRNNTDTIKYYYADVTEASISISAVWKSTMFLAAGILGIIAGHKQTKCTFIGSLVLCAVSCWIALAMTSNNFSIAYAEHAGRCCEKFQASIVAIHATATVLGILEILFSIWGAVVYLTALVSQRTVIITPGSLPDSSMLTA